MEDNLYFFLMFDCKLPFLLYAIVMYVNKKLALWLSDPKGATPVNWIYYTLLKKI